MWRDSDTRTADSERNLALAKNLWAWEPHPAQKEFILNPAQIKIAACGRRWGKTDCLAVEIAALALTRPGSRQLIIAPTDDQARLLGDRVAALLGNLPPGEGVKVVIRQRPYLRITVSRSSDKKSSEVHCRTAGRNGSALRGQAADRIIVDEAALVPDCVLTEVLQPMLLDSGGEMILASTPDGRRNQFYRMWARGMAEAAQTSTLPSGHPSPLRGEGLVTIISPNVTSLSPATREKGGANAPDRGPGPFYAAFQHPSSDNPHLDAGMLCAQREDQTEDAYAVEYLAQFRDDFGSVFRDEDIDGGIAADSAVAFSEGNALSEPVPGHAYDIGIDWARSHDFTVLAVVDSTPTPARLVHLERWRGVSWEQQVIRSAATIARFRPRRVLADGNSIGDVVIDDLQRALQLASFPNPPVSGGTCASAQGGGSPGGGFPPVAARAPTVERFTFSPESKRNLIDRLNSRLSARALTYPPHRALLSEMRSYEYGGTPTGRLKMGARRGGHDDCVTALALACYAAPDGLSGGPRDYMREIMTGSQMGFAARQGGFA